MFKQPKRLLRAFSSEGLDKHDAEVRAKAFEEAARTANYWSPILGNQFLEHAAAIRKAAGL